ncbi:hypothetical protein B0I35DRAFT_485012 [Stachybotrys elegans]|uniref:Uncharacterized protein n=1 Tax=Stachybotrys elegans TaxID=80388 RepID=A0A8K0SGC9_9HYPO|nr:hypothetical protein B0I35DRAFT_485012 [Stachybotrys elegans]
MKASIMSMLAVAVLGVRAASTVSCNGCPESVSAEGIVSRTDAPSSSCTDPPLTVISSNTTLTRTSDTVPTGGMPGDVNETAGPTPTPVPGAGNTMGSSLVLPMAMAGFCIYYAI